MLGQGWFRDEALVANDALEVFLSSVNLKMSIQMPGVLEALKVNNLILHKISFKTKARNSP